MFSSLKNLPITYETEGFPLEAWGATDGRIGVVNGEGVLWLLGPSGVQKRALSAIGFGEAHVDETGLWLRDLKGHWQRRTLEGELIGVWKLPGAAKPVGQFDQWWTVAAGDVWRLDFQGPAINETRSGSVERICFAPNHGLAAMEFASWKKRTMSGAWEQFEMVLLPAREFAWMPAMEAVFFTLATGEIGFFRPFAASPSPMMSGAKGRDVRLLGSNGHNRMGLYVAGQLAFIQSIENEPDAFTPLGLEPFPEMPAAFCVDKARPWFGWITPQGFGAVSDVDAMWDVLSFEALPHPARIFIIGDFVVEINQMGIVRIHSTIS
jgi:hypothetical protein